MTAARAACDPPCPSCVFLAQLPAEAGREENPSGTIRWGAPEKKRMPWRGGGEKFTTLSKDGRFRIERVVSAPLGPPRIEPTNPGTVTTRLRRETPEIRLFVGCIDGEGGTSVRYHSVSEAKEGAEKYALAESAGSVTLDTYCKVLKKGFITNYARKGGPEENFAEMVAEDAMGRLPDWQVALLEPVMAKGIARADEKRAAAALTRLPNPVAEAERTRHPEEMNRHDALDRAEKLLGVTLRGDVYGCGSGGCVASLIDGRVLKVTFDPWEADAVDEVMTTGDFSGFARIFVSPAPLAAFAARAWAYVREDVRPLMASGDTALSRGLQKESRLLARVGTAAQVFQASYAQDPVVLVRAKEEYEDSVDALGKKYSGIASTLRSLAKRDVYLFDIGLHNIGLRPDGTAVLFDAQAVVNGRRLANPAAEPVSEARVRACRKVNQGTHWIREDRRHAVYHRDHYTCVYCGYRDASRTGHMMSLDHLIPCEHGGSNDNDNIVTCCGSCNSTKGAMTKRAFYAYLVEVKKKTREFAQEIQAEIRRRVARRIDRDEGKLLAERAHQHRQAHRQAARKEARA